ncbi:MAG TPA: DNA polymerase III subunit alpha [Thermoanaerobaculia bacterium]|nr:DNA polymerase III subunit alpha [Thermoanaerobaculia bacterium]
MAQFAHLHLHSQYSLLDGANRIDEVIAGAVEKGMPAIALTDHGNMFGAIEFYDKAKAAGIKPIIGIEAYVAQGSMVDRDPQRGRSNHLVLLAKNETGYRNLLRLTTKSYLEGFYYKPRIDKDLLRRSSEGLIALSACLNGEISEQILAGAPERAQAVCHEFLEIFGEGNFFLELQDHGIPEQRDTNDVMRRLAARTGVPLVATNDCHYLRHEDSFAHDVLLCIGTQKTLDDPDRLRYHGEQFYLKSADEMLRALPGDAIAIENTLRIAEQCNLEIPTGSFHLPEFPVPAGYTRDSYLTQVAREGLEVRLDKLRRSARAVDRHPPEAYARRLEQELEVIVRMGFAGYFLIVWDFVRYAREERIPVGPGRGSAAGSLVSYALGITDIDPLRYDLLFERFLNPDRISMPDIDIDFCMRRRGEVIHYVSEKYGRDRVAQIITFGTLGAKAVLRDVGRVLGVPYGKIDRVAKLVPDMTKSLSEAAREIEVLKQEAARDPEVAKIVEVGTRLEGLTRHASLHAAGVVIAPRAIEELVPLYKTSKDEIVTQWDKDVVESLGLLKMDFLGLRTLTVIDDTLKTLEHLGTPLDLDDVPLDDPGVYRLFCEGRTNGIFQFESRGMKDLLRRARPSKFEDLAAFNALYRPGALSVGMVEEFIQRKNGQKRVRYIVPAAEPILAETYGVIAYQEQVMQIAVAMAGFTAGEADVLRKAMGKKKQEVMAEQKEKFLAGAVAKGYRREQGEEMWNYIEPFAGYGFNKSHSVAYAMLAYKTAYLKAHFPVAFMAAMLSSEMSSADDVAKYVRECRDLGIDLRPPDVNESRWQFTVEGEAIRFGLGAVKGVGETAIEEILQARSRVGRFRGLYHLASEVDTRLVNHKVFECLIKAGCFDPLGFRRRALCERLDAVLEAAQRRRREREQGQSSLFAASGEEPEPPMGDAEWPARLRLQNEREALGLYLSGNPLSEFEAVLRGRTTHGAGDLAECAGATVTLGGLLTRLRQTKIKTGPNAGRFMGRFVLSDLQGDVPVVLFSEQLERNRRLLVEDTVVLVTGQVRDANGDPELRAEKIESLEEATAPDVEVHLDLPSTVSMGQMLELRNLLSERPGPARVLFRVALPEGAVRVAAGEQFRVKLDDDLLEAIAALLGAGRVTTRLASQPELEAAAGVWSAG